MSDTIKSKNLDLRNKRSQELKIKRQRNFELSQYKKLIKLYEKKENEINKKYKIDKNYDKNIFWVVILNLIIAILGVTQPELHNLAIVLSLSCIISCALVIVRKIYYKKDNEQKRLLIRNEINYEFKKELINIRQHYESLGYSYPNIEINNIQKIDYK